MNYFELYPGDYLRDTTRLTLLEHGAYLRLLMAYYAEEQPLPADLDDLYLIAGAVDSASKKAVKKVAEKYFKTGPDGARHNGRADDEIAKAADRMEGSGEKKGNEVERQKRTRARRSKLFADLREVGIVPDAMTSMAELKALHAENVTRDMAVTERDLSRVVTGVNTATRPQTPDPTRKATAGTTHTTGGDEQHDPPRGLPGVGTAAGKAAVAMNRAGCRVTSQNPNLIAAKAEGVSDAALVEFVRLYPDKPAGYVIAAARRQHAEGATPTGATHAQQPGRRLSAVERVEANIRANRLARGELDTDDAIEGQATRVSR